MSTLHKVKAYFGMAPMEDYDDEYYEDDDRGSRGYSRRPRDDRFDDDGYGRDYDEPPAGYRGGYRDEDRFEARLRGPREFDRPTPRFSALRGSTRGALAMDPRRMAALFEGQPAVQDHHAAPEGPQRARTIGGGSRRHPSHGPGDHGQRRRQAPGDFAAGLAFGLRGSFDKVAARSSCSPADIDVSAEGAGTSPGRLRAYQ
jgi:cell division inhibitor SepF